MAVTGNALDHIVINVSDVGALAAIGTKKPRHGDQGVRSGPPGKTPRTSLLFGNQKINVGPHDADKVEWSRRP